MKLSLRSQISLWLGGAIVIIVFSTIFITQQIVVWGLEKSIDENLQKRGYMVASLISSDITTDEASYARVISDLASQQLSFVSYQLRVTNPSGRPIVEFGKLSDSIIQELDYQLGSGDVTSGRFETISSGADPLRSFTVAAPDPRTHAPLAYVQIIEPLSQVQQTRQGLWRKGIIIGLIGSFLAIAIGQILMRRAFRPLYAIVGAINKADYDHLRSGMQEKIGTVELEQLAKSLSAMWLRLDMAVTEKKKVIGNMSHDLRTPLTALQGQLEVLLGQPDLTSEIRDSLERMLDETHRLSRMVKNVLLNVQLESSPTLMVEDVNLKEIVDQVVGDMWALAEGLELNIIASEDIHISGGRDLLIQMIMNVVDNAIKFTSKGGDIELELIREGDWAVIRVSDTGRGIPEDRLAHVTEPFHRVGLTHRSSREGAGLGLAIVKQVANLHQGKVEIQSKVGLGTTVIIRLPIKQNGPEQRENG